MKNTSPTDGGCTTVLVIIGAMKSGTTSLFNLLAQHPDVCPSSEKEPEYFTANISHKVADYLELWPQRQSHHKVLMEASTGYTKAPQHEGVAEKMRALKGLNFRLIYIMRHPLERIESQIRHGLYAGWNPSLDEGMRPRDNIVNISRYAMQLDPYIDNFDRESILLLSLEELEAQPKKVLQKVCQHIGVDSSHTFTQLYTKANNGERFQAQQVANKISSGSNPTFRVLRGLLTMLLGRKAKQLWRFKVLQKDRGRFRLSPKEKHDILLSLDADLARLKSEHGINTDQLWGISTNSKAVKYE